MRVRMFRARARMRSPSPPKISPARIRANANGGEGEARGANSEAGEGEGAHTMAHRARGPCDPAKREDKGDESSSARGTLRTAAVGYRTRPTRRARGGRRQLPGCTRFAVLRRRGRPPQARYLCAYPRATSRRPALRRYSGRGVGRRAPVPAVRLIVASVARKGHPTLFRRPPSSPVARPGEEQRAARRHQSLVPARRRRVAVVTKPRRIRWATIAEFGFPQAGQGAKD